MEFISLIEILKAIGRVFYNPLLYWLICLVFISAYRREKQEKLQFQTNVHSRLSELRGTWIISVVASVFISILMLGIGVTFTYEIIFIISALIIISFSYKFTLLSASFTLGFTYLVLKFLLSQNMDLKLPEQPTFSILAALIGVFLLIEAILFMRMKNNDSFPRVFLSDRGMWFGEHQLKKLSFIPFLVLVPNGSIIPTTDFWPYFSIGEQSYSLFLIPFVIGFELTVRGELPQQAARRLGKYTFALGCAVLIFSLLSFDLPGLSFIAVIIAIVGRAYIHFQHYKEDRKKGLYFIQGESKLRVLGVIDQSQADQLGIEVGDVISKVNGQKITSLENLESMISNEEQALQFKVINSKHEVRYVNSPLLKGSLLELGFIFPQERSLN